METTEEYMDYCEYCKKETVHETVDIKPGHEATGLLDSVKIECQECGFSFWV